MKVMNLISLLTLITSELDNTTRFSPDFVFISNSTFFIELFALDSVIYWLRSCAFIKFNSIEVCPINSSLLYPVNLE